MEKIVKGKTWKFGDDFDVDYQIFPFRYVLQNMGGIPVEKLVHHVMEVVDPEFSTNVKRGDFVVAGRNFGHGKPHRQGAECLKILGVSAVIADSIAPIFFKGMLYHGLAGLIGDGISSRIRQGNELEVNLETGDVRNLSTGETFKATPIVPPEHALFPILEAGGQIAYIKKKLAVLQKP
jgi:3-isopropylmalate/(R)-2-methylmalate dehydratase small subunit